MLPQPNGEFIFDEINTYLDESLYNYAVMIDGEWGSGKTYFVKEELSNSIEKHELNKYKIDNTYLKKTPIYASLYGISDLDSIDDRILFAFHKINSRSFQKLLKETSGGFSKLTKNNFGIHVNFKKILFSGKYFKDTVLIFDDLERVECDLHKVFGYINNYVEHLGIKVIIIANNRELDLKLENNIPKVSENLKIDSVKEKLIGKKIKYTADYKNIAYEILKKTDCDTSLLSKLKESFDTIFKTMEIYNHLNIRTLQFFYLKIIRIYNIIKNSPKIMEYCFNDMISYMILICVLHKSDNYINNWDISSTQIKKIKPIKQSDTEKLGYKFLDDYIIDNIIEKDIMIKELQSHAYDLELMKNEKYTPYNRLMNWRHLDSTEEIISSIHALNAKLNSGNYAPNFIHQLIAIIFNLYSIKIIDYDLLEESKSAFKTQIEKFSTEEINVFNPRLMILQNEGEARKDFALEEFIIDLEKTINKLRCSTESIYDELSEILKHDDWITKLKEYIVYNSTNLFIKAQFLSLLDCDELCKKILSLPNCNYDELRDILDQIYLYGQNFQLPEAEYLNSLYEKLSGNMENLDLVKKHNIMLLNGNLQRYKKSIQNKQKNH